MVWFGFSKSPSVVVLRWLGEMVARDGWARWLGKMVWRRWLGRDGCGKMVGRDGWARWFGEMVGARRAVGTRGRLRRLLHYMVGGLHYVLGYHVVVVVVVAWMGWDGIGAWAGYTYIQ